ncbi:MAG: hypothetical protein V1743_00200, partial [Nanoarchaeota archaeon]
MIVIRTNHDPQTSYLYEWTAPLIAEAEQRGFKVNRIEGKDITLKRILSVLKSRKVRFIFFNGHGTDDSLYDNGQQPFIDASSASAFKDAVAFTRSCDSLKTLGGAAVSAGCPAFIGYKKKFWIAHSHKRECQPLKDDVARPIIECSNVVVHELLKGRTVEDAVKRSQEKSAEQIIRLIWS